MLPIRPSEPVAMQALCLSPIHAGVTGSMNGSLSSKLAFVSTHLIWTHLLEPPNSLCEDVSISDSEAFRKALEQREKDMKEGCAIGCRLPSFDAYVDEARYVEPQGERIPCWHEYALDHMTCPFCLISVHHLKLTCIFTHSLRCCRCRAGEAMDGCRTDASAAALRRRLACTRSFRHRQQIAWRAMGSIECLCF